ncbi:hypothetical protein [Aeromonas salmonicida]
MVRIHGAMLHILLRSNGHIALRGRHPCQRDLIPQQRQRTTTLQHTIGLLHQPGATPDQGIFRSQ